MKELRLHYPVLLMSRLLSVSASGYYAWLDRPPSKRAQEETRLEIEKRAAHKRTRQTYSPERLQHDLAEHGIHVGVSRIKRIRKKLGIKCKQKRKFKATTNSKHTHPVLKQELVHHRRYATRNEAMREIREYIEVFYNRQRRQARLGYLSPAAYERKILRRSTNGGLIALVSTIDNQPHYCKVMVCRRRFRSNG